MEYKSIKQIAEKVSLPYEVVTPKEVQQVLKKLGYLDRYNTPTLKAIVSNAYILGQFKGREYFKWSEDVELEVVEIIYSRRNNK